MAALNEATAELNSIDLTTDTSVENPSKISWWTDTFEDGVEAAATEEELKGIYAVREQVRSAIDELPIVHPEYVSGWKFLRFFRGHDSSVDKSVKAYLAMLKYHKENNVDHIREEILATAGKTDSLEEAVEKILYPYSMEKFELLRKQAWGGTSPVVYVESDPATGTPITLTAMCEYHFNKIIAAGLSDLWVDLVDYCQVMMDLVTHVASVELHHLGPSALRLLRRMENSAMHYPESLFRTDAVNIGSVGMALWKMGHMFVPRQTRLKFKPHGSACASASTQLPPSVLPRRLMGTSHKYADTVDSFMRFITVGARSSATVKFALGADDLGTTGNKRHVAWTVELDSYDIAIKVLFVASPDTTEPLVIQDYGDPTSGVGGSWNITQAPGEIHLVLNNTHSRLRSKAVKFHIAVRENDANTTDP